MCLAIRTNAAALTLAARIRGELRAIDPRLAVAEIETMDQQRDRVLSRERLIATLSALFAVIAALLASIGLYGVVSFLVARRTNEIGVRLALGASRGRVARMILESSFLLLLPGLAAGVSLALGAGRLVRARLYGLSPADPISIAGAIGLMALVIALASLLPAYRAARVDPISALRYE
jgi:ABC-type antimicrobial peptide transport system permease subunit